MNRAEIRPATLDDDGAWLAYADWLQSHGEPHGELIALDMELERGRTELAVARTELLAKYGAAILGDSIARFLASGYAQVSWQRGHIVDFEYKARGGMMRSLVVGWLLALIDEHREPFHFVQRFAFPASDLADVSWFTKFTNLETIDISYCHTRDLMPLAKLPKLINLDVTGVHVDVGHLRALRKQTPNLTLVSEYARAFD